MPIRVEFDFSWIKAVGKRKELLVLLLLLAFAIYLRIKSYNPSYVQPMADAWYFVRLAELIEQNGLAPPAWDVQSHFPYGRPLDPFYGWAYLLALLHRLLPSLSLLEVANLAPLVMTIAFTLVAYCLALRFTSSKFAALMAAALIAFSPAVIGLTMAGMADNDCSTIFFVLLDVLTLLYAYERRSILSYLLAILVLTLSMRFWVGSFHVIYLFALAVMLNWLRLRSRDEAAAKEELRFLLLTFVPILILTELWGVGILSWALNLYVWQGEMIVNYSVAELQPLKLSRDWKIIETRVGVFPLYFSLLLPLYFLFKWKEAPTKDWFLLIWYCFSFAMAIRGIRFSLLLSLTSALATAYLVKQLLAWERVSKYSIYLKVFLICCTAFFVLNAPLFAQPQPVSQNWLDTMQWLRQNAKPGSLIFTYWDPGHFINYFGFKTTGDGAHCSTKLGCIVTHNERIQDEARVFVTSNESEAIEIIKKYVEVNETLCNETKQRFPVFSEEYCKEPPEVYFIVSQDLLLKSAWLSYYGGLRDGSFRFRPSWDIEYYSNPGSCYLSTARELVWCVWVMRKTGDSFIAPLGNFTLINGTPWYLLSVAHGGRLGGPVSIHYPVQYYWIQGETREAPANLTDEWGRPYPPERRIKGIFLDLGEVGVYFPPELKRSILFRTFFEDGRGLKCFELVKYYPELRIFKIKPACLG